jgi:putative transposase
MKSQQYGVSYRDLEEIMAECGVSVDHATLNKWVRYSPRIADEAKKHKQSVAGSWRIDETHIKGLLPVKYIP